jgi:hypothetical protein
MLRARTSRRFGWLLAALAGALLVGCAGTTPTSGPGKAAPPADQKPADKDGKSPPPQREIG